MPAGTRTPSRDEVPAGTGAWMPLRKHLARRGYALPRKVDVTPAKGAAALDASRGQPPLPWSIAVREEGQGTGLGLPAGAFARPRGASCSKVESGGFWARAKRWATPCGHETLKKEMGKGGQTGLWKKERKMPRFFSAPAATGLSTLSGSPSASDLGWGWHSPVPRPEPLRARPRQARLKRQAGGRAGRVGGKRRGRERAGKDGKPAPPGRTGRLPAPAEWPGAPRLLPRGGARTGRGAHVARSGRRVGVRGSSWDKALGEPGLRGTRRRRPVFRRERRGSQGLTGPRPWVEDAVVNTGPGPLIPPL